MNIAIILAGGTGTRLGKNIPKQYLKVGEKPVIAYCLEQFQTTPSIDGIFIVAEEKWQDFIKEWIDQCGIHKFKGFAVAGSSRQHSILNGIKKALELGAADNDNIILHDAARPNLSQDLIESCINGLAEADGVMPVLPAKDTMYLSEDGKQITSLLDRSQVFGGQAPESFKLGKYYSLHLGMDEDDLSKIRGSSEIAYKNGLKIRLVEGDEHNYKITTMADLKKFQSEIETR